MPIIRSLVVEAGTGAMAALYRDAATLESVNHQVMIAFLPDGKWLAAPAHDGFSRTTLMTRSLVAAAPLFPYRFVLRPRSSSSSSILFFCIFSSTTNKGRGR